MKLRNKKTGEIIEGTDLLALMASGDDFSLPIYHSIAELNKEWEDYVERKPQFYIDCDGRIFENHTTEYIKGKMQEIGNYFETKEEAEKAVEKLKAWKRLKDKGFHFLGWSSAYNGDSADFYVDWLENDSKDELDKDLDLLFGGEDEK